MKHHPHGPSALGNPCQGAYHMARLAPPQPASDAADEGTLLHAAVACLDTTGMDEEQHRAVEACWHEVAALVALAPAGANYYEETLSLCYETSLILFGTVDYYRIDGRIAWLRDWKFGRNAAPLADVQIAAYSALVMANHPQVQEVHAATFQPRARHHEVSATYTRAELPRLIDAIRERIAWREAWRLGDALATGDHCAYCPAALWCGARQQELATTGGMTEEAIAYLDGATVAGLLPKAKRAGKLIDALKDHAKTLAAGGELPGYELQEVRGREKLDGSPADIYQALRFSEWTHAEAWECVRFDLASITGKAKAKGFPNGEKMLPLLQPFIGRGAGYQKLIESKVQP